MNWVRIYWPSLYFTSGLLWTRFCVFSLKEKAASIWLTVRKTFSNDSALLKYLKYRKRRVCTELKYERRVLGFPQRFPWDFPSYAIWRRLTEFVVPDVSIHPNSLVFNGEIVWEMICLFAISKLEDETFTLSHKRNFPRDAASYLRRTDSSGTCKFKGPHRVEIRSPWMNHTKNCSSL